MAKLTASLFVFGLTVLTAHSALAFEGKYVAGSKDYRQRLEIAKRADGRFSVSAVVGTEGCSGSVEGVGAADGDTLKVEAKEDNFTCVLTLRRTKKGVSVEEGEGCADFHGPSCEVTGDYRKRR